MDQLAPVILTRKHRRRFTPEFKQQVLEACDVPGQSVASVARQFDLNANLLHKWRRVQCADRPIDFVRLPVQASSDIASTSSSQSNIRIELPGNVVAHWPVQDIDRSVAWLKAMISG